MTPHFHPPADDQRETSRLYRSHVCGVACFTLTSSLLSRWISFLHLALPGQRLALRPLMRGRGATSLAAALSMRKMPSSTFVARAAAHCKAICAVGWQSGPSRPRGTGQLTFRVRMAHQSEPRPARLSSRLTRRLANRNAPPSPSPAVSRGWDPCRRIASR